MKDHQKSRQQLLEEVKKLNNEISDLKSSENVSEPSKSDPVYSALLSSNKMWELTFDAIPDLIALIDKDFHIKKMNKSMAEFFKREDVIGNTCFSIVHKTDEPPEYCPNAKLLLDGKVHIGEFYEERLGKHLIVTVTPIYDKNQLMGSVHIVHDDTNRKIAEETQKILGSIVENSNDAIIATDQEGKILSWNYAAEKMYGYSAPEMIGKQISLLLTESEKLSKSYEKIRTGEKIRHYQTQKVHKSGKIIDISLTISPIRDWYGNIVGASSIARDITHEKKAEEQIKKSLKEKETLLKEIHHRVKNNLMIISSLLNLQSKYLKDKYSMEIFKESQNRAKSMALIHQRLYMSTDLKNIGFKEYITTLAHDLYSTYMEDPGRVELKLDVEDIKLDINTAIPLGLILNELITNSLKYAFPHNKKGTVTVAFLKKEEEYILKVGDDGVGFPPDLNYQNTKSLGLQLVNSLTEQIDGEIKLDREDGTTFKIIFNEPEIS